MEAETAEDIINEDNPEIKAYIMGAVQKVNRKAVSNAAKVDIIAVLFKMFYFFSTLSQVHKFMIAPTDFSLAGGELTPTMKVKRHFVIEKYQKKIQQMYEHETQSSMW